MSYDKDKAKFDVGDIVIGGDKEYVVTGHAFPVPPSTADICYTLTPRNDIQVRSGRFTEEGSLTASEKTDPLSDFERIQLVLSLVLETAEMAGMLERRNRELCVEIMDHIERLYVVDDTLGSSIDPEEALQDLVERMQSALRKPMYLAKNG